MEISVITSATGAVIKDIINVLSRRSPNITLTLVEAQVQGKQAEKSICNAIERVNSFRQSDLIILARGGGSMEDLWCFNIESVARSIFNSEIPLRCSNKKLSSLFFQSYVFLALEGASNSGLVNIRYIARIHVAGKQ